MVVRAAADAWHVMQEWAPQAKAGRGNNDGPACSFQQEASRPRRCQPLRWVEGFCNRLEAKTDSCNFSEKIRLSSSDR